MPSRKTETILVVDDSEAVCEVIEILLCRAGYRVLTATNGSDALQIALETPEIDLLMSDIEMPGMRGDELAAHFSRLNPAVPIVFVARAEEAHCANGAEKRASFLPKPFTVAELRDTVLHALRSRRILADDAPCAA